jgi:hypothetical protein
VAREGTLVCTIREEGPKRPSTVGAISKGDESSETRSRPTVLTRWLTVFGIKFVSI